MFSSKIKDLNLLYTFWLALLNRDDNLFICYFGVALLQYYKSEIQNQDMMSFPVVFKRIFIENYDTLVTVLGNSDQIKNNTPISAEMALKKYNMFRLENTEAFAKILEKALCLLVLPREILERIYPDNLIAESSSTKVFSVRGLSHLLLDCRSSKEHKLGNFHNSHLLSKSAYKNPQKLADYPKKFMTIRKNYHITLMGSGALEIEDGILHRLYRSFILHDFPYISMVDGGYSACHEFAIQHNYLLRSHNPKKCTACDCQNKEVIESALDKFFRLNPTEDTLKNEKVYMCSLSDTTNISESDLGLVVTPTTILLYNINHKDVVDVLYISKLCKITSNKVSHEMLSFSFEGSVEKKVFKLNPHEVKDFLRRVKDNYKAMKQINSNIKKLI